MVLGVRDASLPSRERELKQAEMYKAQISQLSLPSRERELKLESLLVSGLLTMSLPSRERELKLDVCRFFGVHPYVAPFTGA